MNNDKQIIRRKLLEELVNRQGHERRGAERVLPSERELLVAQKLRDEETFPIQRECFWGPHKRKAILCSRRSGKTYGLALLALYTMLVNPKARILYLAQTGDSARSYIWKDLRDLCDKYDLTDKVFKFNETRLWIGHIRGRGVAIFAGANDRKQVEKYRGQKWDIAVIDEAGVYPDETLKTLCTEIIGASLRDLGGTFIVSGTPGRVPHGYWHQLSTGTFWNEEKQQGWKDFFWTLQDNPHLPAEAKDHETICFEDGLTRQDPRFIREYLGKWHLGEDGLMFKFDPRQNVWSGEPKDLPREHVWNYLLGCDFGYEDESALAVVAWSTTTKTTYIMETWAKNRTMTDGIAREIFRLRGKYPIKRMVGDIGGAGKFYQQALLKDYKLFIEKANKTEKLDHVDFQNSAMMRRDYYVPKEDMLAAEYLQIAWNADRTDAHNHSKDNRAMAALYAWRTAYYMAGKKQLSKPVPTDLQEMALHEKMQALGSNNDKPKTPWYAQSIAPDLGQSNRTTPGSLGSWGTSPAPRRLRG
jgi:PBSX family phage terminase large subunit